MMAIGNLKEIVMLYSERTEVIMQQLQLQAVVKISDLTQLLGVSVDTVRRDLRNMEQEGLIKCVRGGARLPETLSAFSNFKGREIVHSDLKREAAKKAVRYVQSGSLVALNAGTTNTILAQELVQRNDRFTVVTNNLAAIQILMQNSSIDLIAIGGMIDVTEQSTYGTVCEREFGEYYPDIAFLAVNAVNYQDGFTDFRLRETGIIQLLTRQSQRVIPVMDSSKLGKRAKKKILSLDQVDRLVADDQVPQRLKEKYKDKGLIIE